MRWARIVAPAVLLACAFGYVAERMADAPQGHGLAKDGGLARGAGVYSPELSDAPEIQLAARLEADARRRHERFLEVLEPGRAMARTRIDEAAIGGGQLGRGALADGVLDEGRMGNRGFGSRDLYALGAELFHHRFTRAEGFGGRDLPAIGRVHRGLRGGPDSYACADCHRRGGPAGAGDAVDNAYYDGDGDRPESAFERNPPSLVGAGVIELLAREMTAELRLERDRLVQDARNGARAITIELVAKGVSFGQLSADGSGALDYRAVRGVDPNLEVKPFGWKGHSASLRDFVEDELALHHGMQTEALVRTGDVERIGPFGGGDPDGDGVGVEITGGQLTLLVAFLAMQEIPTESPPTDSLELGLYARGRVQFDQLGCAGCHVPSLQLESSDYAFEGAAGTSPLRIDLAVLGAEPRIVKDADGGHRVFLYSDLKRHVVGPNLREGRRYRGVSEAAFLTPPLWGIARSRPYLHDGSAPTLEHAILAHGGEAHASMQAFEALDQPSRAPLRVFLTSLTRAQRISVP
ncbi:MAG: hypothetical protein EXR75_16910 [Myxococcales bacterium]|nr:hypothetical protein [Myxococcales bacterium]